MHEAQKVYYLLLCAVSGIGHLNEVDIEQLPDPIPHGEFKKVHMSQGEPTIITFDLETTDLIHGHHYPHITQIAAFSPTYDQSFNRYVLPKEPISFGAQRVTGLSIVDNKLYHNGNELPSVDIHQALHSFCSWLKKFDNAILVAHCGKRFDFPILVSAANAIGLIEQYLICVQGCVDSLALFKKVFPGRKTYAQEVLVRDILKLSYGAHNALEDVKALGSLTVNACKHLTTSNILDFSFSLKSVFHAQMFNDAKAKNIQSLNELVVRGVCKPFMAEKIAGSGLNIHHLRQIFERKGEDGLRNTFTVRNSEGKPRVTNYARTLDSIIPKLAEHFTAKK